MCPFIGNESFLCKTELDNYKPLTGRIMEHNMWYDQEKEIIHLEFTKDNDYKRIQKIIATAERFELSKEEINILLNEAMEIFEADGHVDILEREMFIGLRRVLK